jgi:site-specific recombinase XerD
MSTFENSTLSMLFWVYTTRKNKKNEYPIYCRITVDGQRAELSLKHSIKEENWDHNAQRVKPKDPSAHLINPYIDHVRGRINMIFNQHMISGTYVTAAYLKDRFLGKKFKSEHKSLLEAIDYHNLKMEEQVDAEQIHPKTLMRFKIMRTRLIEFMELNYKTNDILLPDIKLAFIKDFDHYLMTKVKIHTNTTQRYVKNLKKIMHMAVAMEWIPTNPFNAHKCNHIQTDREILTMDEINRMRNKDFGFDRLNEVRDVFIFCCFTGYAYTDVANFGRNAVMIGLDGNYWLSTNRQKTGTKEKVPLLPIALQILQRYKDHEYCIENDKLLPVNSNQRYNAYLKELAVICKINKKLTSHIARHTFATTVTLANGVPIETVSAMLGHTSIKTTQIYAKVVEKKVSEDMMTLSAKLGQEMKPKSKKVV